MPTLADLLLPSAPGEGGTQFGRSGHQFPDRHGRLGTHSSGGADIFVHDKPRTRGRLPEPVGFEGLPFRYDTLDNGNKILDSLPPEAVELGKDEITLHLRLGYINVLLKPRLLAHI